MKRARGLFVVLALALSAQLSAGTGVAAQGSPAPSTPPAPSAALPTCTAIAETPAAAAAPAAPTGTPAPAAGDLTVFAAASLTNTFKAFAPAYLAETGLNLEYSLDSSSALRTQIEQGAPADLFASADTTNVQKLLDENMAVDPVVFACNQLTIIVPASNPASITSPADLAKPGVKIIAAGPDVPITKYATQLVSNLGITDGYNANVVSQEDNVAAVRAKIVTGEGDAGIVYVTDALASGDKVTQIPVPLDDNVPATYAAAVVSATDQADASKAFLDWLTGPEGQQYLASFGFLPAPTASDAFTVTGLVDTPLTLTAADLQSMTPQSVDVTFNAGGQPQSHSYTGVLLSDVIAKAGLTLDASVKNQALHRYLVIHAVDGYEVVISWGEIDPSFGNNPVLLAWEQDGTQLTGDDGPVRLVTPGDVNGGRYATGVRSIEVRDIDSAPRP